MKESKIVKGLLNDISGELNNVSYLPSLEKNLANR